MTGATEVRPGDARYVTVGGVEFAYLEDGPADGPLALLLHGFPDHARTWRGLMTVLAGAGFRAVAPWMRGYAPTAVPADRRYDLDTLGRDVNALRDALAGDRQAVVVGHDWGALAAYRAVAAAPGAWRAVVGLAVPPEPALTFTRANPWQLRRSWYVALFQVPGAEAIVRADDYALVERLWRAWSPGYVPDPDDMAALKATLRAPGTLPAVLGYYRGLRGWFAGAARRTRSGPLPTVPLLYLHGRDDGCIGVEYAVFARIVLEQAADATVDVLDGCGHFLHHERPDDVAERVLDLLARTAGSLA